MREIASTSQNILGEKPPDPPHNVCPPTLKMLLTPMATVLSSMPQLWLNFIMSYYTAVLNAVECSIHLNGASQRSAVNNFLIFDRCYAHLTAVKGSGLFASDSRLS